MDVFERYPAPPPPAPPPVDETPPPEPVHYETQFPYVPPDVEVYYEPARPAQPPVVPVDIATAEARAYGHMESFYSEPPMTHGDVYPQRDVAYGARETVQTLTEMAPRPPLVQEPLEQAQRARAVEQLPPAPAVEEQIRKTVRSFQLIVAAADRFSICSQYAVRGNTAITRYGTRRAGQQGFDVGIDSCPHIQVITEPSLCQIQLTDLMGDHCK